MSKDTTRQIKINFDHYIDLLLDRMRLEVLDTYSVNETKEWKHVMKNFNETEDRAELKKWLEKEHFGDTYEQPPEINFSLLLEAALRITADGNLYFSSGLDLAIKIYKEAARIDGDNDVPQE